MLERAKAAFNYLVFADTDTDFLKIADTFLKPLPRGSMRFSYEKLVDGLLFASALVKAGLFTIYETVAIRSASRIPDFLQSNEFQRAREIASDSAILAIGGLALAVLIHLGQARLNRWLPRE